MSPRKVWAATSGEYDDWNVDAIFETEEDAVWSAQHGVGTPILWYLPPNTRSARNPEEFMLYGPGEQPPGGHPLTLRDRVAHDPDATILDQREHVAVLRSWESDGGPVVSFSVVARDGASTDVVTYGPNDQTTRDAFDAVVVEVRAQIARGGVT